MEGVKELRDEEEGGDSRERDREGQGGQGRERGSVREVT